MRLIAAHVVVCAADSNVKDTWPCQGRAIKRSQNTVVCDNLSVCPIAEFQSRVPRKQTTNLESAFAVVACNQLSSILHTSRFLQLPWVSPCLVCSLASSARRRCVRLPLLRSPCDESLTTLPSILRYFDGILLLPLFSQSRSLSAFPGRS